MQATEWLLSVLDQTKSVLDVGIGTGDFWKDHPGFNVRGFDINNKKPGVDVVMGNVCLGLPFQAKAFQTGTMLNVLEVLPDSCRQHAVNELARVSDIAIVVSGQPLIAYGGAGMAEFFSDAVDGKQWYGMIINRPPQNLVQENQPDEKASLADRILHHKKEEPQVESPPEEKNDPEDKPDDDQQDEEPKKKKPFWKRPVVRGIRIVSVLVGVLNFIKYLFQHETITIPVEISSMVPIIGGSVTHYRIAMATYEAINAVRNYLSKA